MYDGGESIYLYAPVTMQNKVAAMCLYGDRQLPCVYMEIDSCHVFIWR